MSIKHRLQLSFDYHVNFLLGVNSHGLTDPSLVSNCLKIYYAN